MQPSTFDVIQGRKCITVVKVDKLLLFKHFLGDKELFGNMAENHVNRMGRIISVLRLSVEGNFIF
jgi:hypothetical protein